MFVRLLPAVLYHESFAVVQCILELREKAKHFERTGPIPTLGASHSIANRTRLCLLICTWPCKMPCPGSGRTRRRIATGTPTPTRSCNLMCPLVYGRSLFRPEQVVGVEDVIDKWAGRVNYPSLSIAPEMGAIQTPEECLLEMVGPRRNAPQEMSNLSTRFQDDISQPDGHNE